MQGKVKEGEKEKKRKRKKKYEFESDTLKLLQHRKSGERETEDRMTSAKLTEHETLSTFLVQFILN